jgi:hypothetical protein
MIGASCLCSSGLLRDDLTEQEQSAWALSIVTNPEKLSAEEERRRLDIADGVTLASDGLIEAWDDCGIATAFTGARLSHLRAIRS